MHHKHIKYYGIDDLLISYLEDTLVALCNGDEAFGDVFNDEHMDWQLATLCTGMAECYHDTPEAAGHKAIVGYCCRDCSEVHISTHFYEFDPEQCILSVSEKHQHHDYVVIYMEV